MLFKVLNQRNKECIPEIWEELQLLYEGGYSVANNADRFIPRLVGEQPKRFQERVKAASYINYLGQIVDSFGAGLFAKGIVVLPPGDAERDDTPGECPEQAYYNALSRNANRKGLTLTGVMKEAFTFAILKRKAAIAIDFPVASDVLLTRADEVRIGEPLAYCYHLPIEGVLDWKYGEDGELDWVIVRDTFQERSSPEDFEPKPAYEFKVWRRREGVVSWELYRTKPFDPDKGPDEDEDVRLVGNGIASFKRIPIVFIDIPHGLWVGNKVGPGAKEHFQRRSTLVGAENRSMVSVPFVKLGPEMSAPGAPLPSEAQQDPHRGDDPVTKLYTEGFVVLGKDDDIGFAEPEGKAYELVNNQLTELKDELFRVCHQMAAAVSNRPSSLSRSGSSKEEDRRVESIVLYAYAEIMRPVIARVYEIISEARDETIFWAVNGLDNFEQEDRGHLLAEAIQMAAIDIPSRTFRTVYKTRIASKLVSGAPPETVEQIRKEITESVATEPHDLNLGISDSVAANRYNVAQEAVGEITRGSPYDIRSDLDNKLGRGTPYKD